MKFFNKARQQAMSKSKVSKYLAYAIGEIILVVIGILIAVSINDWKQDLAHKNELKDIYTTIKSDLIKDTLDIKDVFKVLRPMEKLSDKILFSKAFTKDSLKNCVDCRYLLAGFSFPNFSLKGYKLLQYYNKSDALNQEFSDSISAFYNYSIENIKMTTNKVTEDTFEFVEYLRDSKPWFANYFVSNTCNEDCISYFVSDEYFNRLAYYNVILTEEYLPQLELYNEKAKGFIKAIDSITQK